MTWYSVEEAIMILTSRDQLVLQGKRVRVVGSYNIPEERTNYCKHPEQTDWTKPCPICKRRIRVIAKNMESKKHGYLRTQFNNRV